VQWLLVFIGGGVGSLMRYLTGVLMTAWFGGSFPWATFSVNVLGSLLIGLLATLADERGIIGPQARLFLVVGFLGGFTTFSSFSLETYRLARDGETVAAILNIAGNLGLSLAAVVLGAGLGRVLET
jgi:fluoride exporter